MTARELLDEWYLSFRLWHHARLEKLRESARVRRMLRDVRRLPVPELPR